MKRGFLLAEETLKIVIAVIAISFLIYFLVSLYSAKKDSQNLEFAKASLNGLIDAINKGENQFTVISHGEERAGIERWGIIAWPLRGEPGLWTSTEVDMIPKACSNFGWSSCLWICEASGGTLKRHYLAGCDKLGYCVESSSKVFNSNSAIENYTIPLHDIPLRLNITRDGGKITITKWIGI